MIPGEFVSACARAAEGTKAYEWTYGKHVLCAGQKAVVVAGRKIPKGSVVTIVKVCKPYYYDEADLDCAGRSEMLHCVLHIHSDNMWSGHCNASVLVQLENDSKVWTRGGNLEQIIN